VAILILKGVQTCLGVDFDDGEEALRLVMRFRRLVHDVCFIRSAVVSQFKRRVPPHVPEKLIFSD
jgi:hypothetical protein